MQSKIISTVVDGIIQVSPVIDLTVRKLCVKPYHNHPKGCPNFNKKITCPPKLALFTNYFDISKPIYAIFNKFDLGTHIEKQQLCHPDWSYWQLRNSRHWQNQARAQLKQIIVGFERDHPEYTVTGSPEGMGINVTETMKNAGIILEWPPEKFTYQIAFAGIRR